MICPGTRSRYCRRSAYVERCARNPCRAVDVKREASSDEADGPIIRLVDCFNAMRVLPDRVSIGSAEFGVGARTRRAVMYDSSVFGVN